MKNLKALKLLFKNRSKANELLRNPSGLKKLILSAMLMAKVTKLDELRDIREQLFTLFRMVRNWSNGNGAFISKKNILLVTAAIIYLVNPFDLIVDYLPFYGVVDDIAVIGFVVKSIQKDITRFLEWEAQNTEDSMASDAGVIPIKDQL